ncbi:MAG TPA: YkgJ family cysteine cluster protein [Nitrospira sp.]|nr:YkgJ family cysteine cluster protein [Nitrospira sp.]
MTERYDIALNTPAGRLTSTVEVPTGLVPVSAIVPLMRRLGEEAQALEEQQSIEAGRSLSCKKGCAACCRMLVPVSAPEAFALRDYVQTLPEPERARLTQRLAVTRTALLAHGLWKNLIDIGESTSPPDDAALEPINRAYFALHVPCAFLEQEVCTIYEQRPAACRELLVTSPAEWCRDPVTNPVEALPVPVRIGPALSLLWAELTEQPPKLIPLATALDWAERHEQENQPRWPGTQLLDRALDKIWRFLSQAFQQK